MVGSGQSYLCELIMAFATPTGVPRAEIAPTASVSVSVSVGNYERARFLDFDRNEKGLASD
jgi:hypothetical protein